MEMLYSFLGSVVAIVIFLVGRKMCYIAADYKRLKNRNKIPYSPSYNRYPPVEPAYLTRNDIRGLENRLDDIINEFDHIFNRLEDIEMACLDHIHKTPFDKVCADDILEGKASYTADGDVKGDITSDVDVLVGRKVYGEVSMPHNPPTIE